MRVTVHLDEDVLEAVARIASAERRPRDDVMADLLRRGLGMPADRRQPGKGLPAFEVRQDSPALTLEDIKHDED